MRINPRSLALAVAAAAALALPACEDLPNIPPQADFVFSPVAPIYPGLTTVTFNASLSTDSDGTVSTYVWDFGDGSGQSRQSASTVNHVFTDRACIGIPPTVVDPVRPPATLPPAPTAQYSVLLTVTDDAGESTSASKSLTITCPLVIVNP